MGSIPMGHSPKGDAGMNQNSERKGIFYAGSAYFAWGVLPIYWNLINGISAEKILAHRIIWAFVFMMLILLVTRKMPLFFSALKQLRQEPKKLLVLIIVSLLISANWGSYIWAVNNERILEASLGYYINPLVSVMLGVFILKERLTKAQLMSVVLAFIGVLIMTINLGEVPYIALLLGFSFAFYGLMKKQIVFDAAVGLTVETMIMIPIALIYLLVIKEVALASHAIDNLLLLGTGAVTALPLLYFAKGARFLSLTTLGFLQYIAPTITLLIGVFVYKEAFLLTHFIAFSFIWLALIVFSVSKTKWFVKKVVNEKQLSA